MALCCKKKKNAAVSKDCSQAKIMSLLAGGRKWDVLVWGYMLPISEVESKARANTWCLEPDYIQRCQRELPVLISVDWEIKSGVLLSLVLAQNQTEYGVQIWQTTMLLSQSLSSWYISDSLAWSWPGASTHWVNGVSDQNDKYYVLCTMYYIYIWN